MCPYVAFLQIQQEVRNFLQGRGEISLPISRLAFHRLKGGERLAGVKVDGLEKVELN